MAKRFGSIVAVVLAAGGSRRFGAADKLLFPLDGLPVLEHVFQAIKNCSNPSFDILTVVPLRADAHWRLAEKYGSMVIENQHHDLGMGTSIACAAEFLMRCESRFRGVAIFLGDMPWILPDTLASIAGDFEAKQCEQIVRPFFDGRPGHPVLFPVDLLTELSLLQGDRGAGKVVQSNSNRLAKHEVDRPGVVLDIDCRDDLDRLN